MRLRITFAKLNALRYTGHLDLHHNWERAARRAELPLAYSQGFHPQPKISLASALPLGFSSICEVLDMRLTEDLPLEGLKERIQAAVPSGLQILKVESVDEKLPALQTLVADELNAFSALLTGVRALSEDQINDLDLGPRIKHVTVDHYRHHMADIRKRFKRTLLRQS